MPAVISLMQKADLDAIMEIEHLCFTTPWSRQSFLYELQENQRAIYITARVDGRIVGYVGMWVILDEGHITNLAVHPNHRRLGIARQLLEAMTEIARSRGVNKLTLEVRRSNIGAQLLYAKYGFTCSGVRRRYYRDNNEDALIMWAAI